MGRYDASVREQENALRLQVQKLRSEAKTKLKEIGEARAKAKTEGTEFVEDSQVRSEINAKFDESEKIWLELIAVHLKHFMDQVAALVLKYQKSESARILSKVNTLEHKAKQNNNDKGQNDAKSSQNIATLKQDASVLRRVCNKALAERLFKILFVKADVFVNSPYLQCAAKQLNLSDLDIQDLKLRENIVVSKKGAKAIPFKPQTTELEKKALVRLQSRLIQDDRVTKLFNQELENIKLYLNIKVLFPRQHAKFRAKKAAAAQKKSGNDGQVGGVSDGDESDGSTNSRTIKSSAFNDDSDDDSQGDHPSTASKKRLRSVDVSDDEDQIRLDSGNHSDSKQRRNRPGQRARRANFLKGIGVDEERLQRIKHKNKRAPIKLLKAVTNPKLLSGNTTAEAFATKQEAQKKRKVEREKRAEREKAIVEAGGVVPVTAAAMLHPSWEAKKRQQELQKSLLSGEGAPKAKKIVFD
ncbi:hypothetical protein IWQ60_001528 [Tieghemiomyces parasiticus]|uniref:Bud22 domain-containing protein n=1 Tax=Tieghemiomyces parasiticus TaxID=78921 RepID=A0A9W8AGJ4_9FUNG|nr:hypothetical protein IWQ60_001528 [Tieghemiomyces parasiticus]